MVLFHIQGTEKDNLLQKGIFMRQMRHVNITSLKYKVSPEKNADLQLLA